MGRPGEGTSAARGRLNGVLRGFGVALAVLLGGIAVWLIVTATTRKGIEIGVLTGLWGLLLGAFGVFGTRHPGVVAQAGPAQDGRAHTELARREDAAERREYEHRLEQMLRREVQLTMAAELASLRADVAALRSELVEKVGGQLRLERIETTRVIGSDIEALQHEVRQLMVGRQPAELGSFSLGSTPSALVSPLENLAPAAPAGYAAPYGAVASQSYPSGSHTTTPYPVAAEPPLPPAPGPVPPGPVPSPPGPTPPGPTPPRPTPPKPFPPDPFVPEPLVPQPLVPEPLVPEPLVPEPLVPEPSGPDPFVPDPVAPTPVDPEPFGPEPGQPQPDRPVPLDGDPFASLPRLRPFTDFELDPIEPTAAPAAEQVGASGPTDAPAGNGGPAPAAGPLAPDTGRHATVGDSHPNARGSGGRRRRDPGEEDVLSRILQRERTS